MEADMGTPLFVYIEIIGVIVGLWLIFVLARVTRELGGEVGAALRYLVGGVAVFTLAFVISFVIDFFGLSAMTNSMATHMVLMVAAMILVVLSALRFTRLL